VIQIGQIVVSDLTIVPGGKTYGAVIVVTAAQNRYALESLMSDLRYSVSLSLLAMPNLISFLL